MVEEFLLELLQTDMEKKQACGEKTTCFQEPNTVSETKSKPTVMKSSILTLT